MADFHAPSKLIASSGFAAQKPIIAQVSPFLKDEAEVSAPPQAAAAPVDSAKPKMPAEQVKTFTEKGDEFFKLAHRPGLKLEEQLNHLHTALFNFQMLGDVAKCSAILTEMKELYAKKGNEFGQSYATAQLSFLKGDEAGFSEAIRQYEQLDGALRAGLTGLPPETVDSLRGDLKGKLLLAYVSRAQLHASQGHLQKATLDYEQALYLNPNKAFFELYAKTAAQAGLFDFYGHDSQVEGLRLQRNFLPGEGTRISCISHHKPQLNEFERRERQEKLSAHQANIDAQISAILGQSQKNLQKFKNLMALAYPSATSAERFERDLSAAQLLESFGRPEEAANLYARIMEERKGVKEAAEVLRYATAANHLAAQSLTKSSNLTWGYAEQSINALKGLPATAETQFLLAQAKFIQAEYCLKIGDVDTGRGILETLKAETPVGEPKSLQFQLAGRISVRLAQVYYSRKDTFGAGDALAEEVKVKFKGEAEVIGDVFFAKALSRLGTGRALEAVDILREEVQKPYPQSSAARAIATDPRFQKFLTTQVDEKGQVQQVLKPSSEINEADWTEAFKVAVATSGRGSTERKVAYAAAGGGTVLAGLLMAPEPVATKVAACLVGVGMGIGLLWERFVSASEHSDEIYDAYRTGFSMITDSQNAMNMFLLGADVAMLLTAGMAGSVAKAFVREGLAVAAEEITANMLLRTGKMVAGEDIMIWAGRGVLFVAENGASGAASYTAYQMQRSLFLREEFHWDSSEVLQWMAMTGSIELAGRIKYLGTAAAKLPLFQQGPLKNIVVNGKIVGQSTAEGLAAKWVVDAGFGLSAYLLYERYQGRQKQGYADFMLENLFMMGLLHAGGAMARKVTGGAPEAMISKIDQHANERFAKAREQFDNFEPPSFGLQPAYALAGGGISTQGPGSSHAAGSGRPALIFPGFLSDHMSARNIEALEGTYRDQVSQERAPSKSRAEEVREAIRKQLSENSDWRRDCKGDFSFLDALSAEQLMAIEAVLKVGNMGSQQAGNTHFLYRMKQTGFLQNHLLKLSPESLRAFSKVSGKGPYGRDFAERLFNDYLESNSNTQSGYANQARRRGIIFESLYDPATNSRRSRLDLVLEAYFWMDAAGVQGSKDVIDGVTGEFYDSHRIQDNNSETGWRSRGWDEVKSENQWRGNIDEAIRMGQVARENAWRPHYSDALTHADSVLGDVQFTTVGGGRASDPLQPDGLTRGKWGEEYKSTYDAGKPADFSMSHMNHPEKFQNQVRKYGQAVRAGLLNGVTYRITATSIDPSVIAYIQAHIPNVRVILYDSIANRSGKVVLEQHTQATQYPVSVAEAQRRAVENNYPFTVDNGDFVTYRLPEKVEIPQNQTAEFKDRLLLYTDTLDTKAVGNELATRIRQRAAIHIEWLARVYERLPADRRAMLEARVEGLCHDLDAKLPQYRTEDAKAKLIYESVENLARDVIATELPVWEKVPLGLSGVQIEGSKGESVVNSPLDHIPGSLKLYLTESQIRGPYQRTALRNNLKLPKGARIYTTDLTPQEAHSALIEKGAKQTEKNRDQVLGFDAKVDLENKKLFEKKVDEQGRVYYEVLVEQVIGKDQFQVQYHGQNPKVDYFAPLQAAN